MIFMLIKRCIVLPICVWLFIFFHLSHNYKASTRILKFAIDELGGFFIKTVQFAATHHDLWLSRESYIHVLDSFFDNACPVSAQTIRSVLHKYNIEYESIDEHPIGSGSIAQIHRGRWKGRDVAFKVQKPIAKLQFQIDLFFIHLVLWVITLWLGEIPSTPFLVEFTDCVQKEFDFNQEARAMIQARSWFEHVDSIVIPNVYVHSDQVLIMDFVEHIKLSDNVLSTIDAEKKLQLCMDISDVFADMIIIKRFVHSDPHIGNLCMTKDGQSFVIFDWGQNKTLSDSTIHGLAHIIISDNMKPETMRYGMDLCGIDIQSIAIEHVMMILGWFNHKQSASDPSYHLKFIRQVVQYTAKMDRNQRNPFKKHSRELVLILKTHDLLETVMTNMGFSISECREIFPKSMMRASQTILK